MAMKILFCLAIVTTLVYKCGAIRCYVCSSMENDACEHPELLDNRTRAILIPVVECDLDVSRMPPNGFFCRKLVQRVYTESKYETRVVRDCGWVLGDPSTQHFINRNCYRDKTVDHKEVACQCFTDMCNSADDPVLVTSLFVVLAACLYFYR